MGLWQHLTLVVRNIAGFREFFPAPIVGGSPRRTWKRNSWYKKKMKIIELLAIRFAMVFLDFPNPQASQWNPCGNPACSHSNLVKTIGKPKQTWQIQIKALANSFKIVTNIFLQNSCKIASKESQNSCKIAAKELQNSCKIAAEWLQNSSNIAQKQLQDSCAIPIHVCFLFFIIAKLQYLAWVSKIVPKFFKDLVVFWLILVGRTFAKKIS